MIWCVCLLDCGVFLLFEVFVLGVVLLFRVLLHVCCFIVVFVWVYDQCCCVIYGVSVCLIVVFVYLKFLFCVCCVVVSCPSSCLFVLL